jgi:3-oxoacyl-[acyl-carrier protein] reductase
MLSNDLNVPLRVLVTGGSRGIGLAVAQALGGDGGRTALIARDEERLRDAARTVAGERTWRAADMADAAAIKTAVDQCTEWLGGVDVLVLAAGFGSYFGADTPYEDAVAAWDHEVGVDLRGAFLTCQAAAPYLMRPGGRIIMISSIAAYTGGSTPGAAAYAAAKAGLIGLTRGLARELTPQGITVNAIAPGFIATDFHGEHLDQAAERATALIPAGRVGQPDDVAGTAAFLASPAANYISGQVIHVNGGWLFGA